ncbi:MAG: Ig-like domain-containing protein [Terriglobales bacterium]|jgi:hypothetical protein
MSGHQAILFRASLVLALALALPSCGGGGSSGGSGLTGIDVSPLSQTIAVGDTLQYKATGHFSNGPDQDLTGNATWSSSVTSVATIQNVGTQPGWRPVSPPARPASQPALPRVPVRCLRRLICPLRPKVR